MVTLNRKVMPLDCSINLFHIFGFDGSCSLLSLLLLDDSTSDCHNFIQCGPLIRHGVLKIYLVHYLRGIASVSRFQLMSLMVSQ